MKKNFLFITAFLWIFCTSAFGQLYLTYGHNYMVKHNADGTVDIAEYAQNSCKLYWYSTLEEALKAVCPDGCNYRDNETHRKYLHLYSIIYRNFSEYIGNYPKFNTYNPNDSECGQMDSREAYECWGKRAKLPAWEELEALWSRDREKCYAEAALAKDYLLDMFSDPDGHGFKKIKVGYDYMLALRNDGVFKIKPGFLTKDKEDGLYWGALKDITDKIVDYILPVQHGGSPVLVVLITDSGKQIPIYLKNPDFWHNIFNKEEVEEITVQGKDFMPEPWAAAGEKSPEADFTAEFDDSYHDGIGVVVFEKDKKIGSFKAFRNTHGVTYAPKSVYIKNNKSPKPDTIFVNVEVVNGGGRGLSFCSEFLKLPPFSRLNDEPRTRCGDIY